MEQLIMNWTLAPNRASYPVKLPEGFTFRKFLDNDEDIEAWLDIVQYGLTEGRGNRDTFRILMLEHANYDPDGVFFILKEGKPCATMSVFCDTETLDGYLHMVCAAPSARGYGIGTALARLAVNELIARGMKTARLTTDDFRLPAIRTYLNAGFVPQLSGSEDFPERWDNVLKKLQESSARKQGR